jgi:hypothetical protein
MAVLAATSPESARALGGAMHLATYFDVMPNAVVSGAVLLERYGEATRTQAGTGSVDGATRCLSVVTVRPKVAPHSRPIPQMEGGRTGPRLELCSTS